LAVEEGAALIVQGDRLQVLGSSSAHVFLKSQGGRTLVWHELVPGDTAQLKREVPANAVVRREEALLEKRYPAPRRSTVGSNWRSQCGPRRIGKGGLASGPMGPAAVPCQ